MNQIYAIFRNTLLETVRQPVYGLVLVSSCCLIAVLPAFASHIYTFGAGSGLEHSAERLIADMGLSTVLLAGLVLAVLSSARVVSREIENKTVLTVLSKSVGRASFIIGKYLGVAAAIGIAAMAGTVTILLTVRMGAAVSVSENLDMGVLLSMIGGAVLAVLYATFRNYYRGRAWVGSFALAFITIIVVLFCVFALFDRDYNLVFMHAHAGTEEAAHTGEGAGVTYDWDVAAAGVLILEAVLVMAGVAIAASTRLSASGNFIVCGFVFFAGLTSKFFHGRALEHHHATGESLYLGICDVWQTFMPNMQMFWMSDALTREVAIPMVYVVTASLYAFSYVVAMLFIALFLFNKREIS